MKIYGEKHRTLAQEQCSLVDAAGIAWGKHGVKRFAKLPQEHQMLHSCALPVQNVCSAPLRILGKPMTHDINTASSSPEQRWGLLHPDSSDQLSVEHRSSLSVRRPSGRICDRHHGAGE